MQHLDMLGQIVSRWPRTPIGHGLTNAGREIDMHTRLRHVKVAV
jgi:hypothetical protein